MKKIFLLMMIAWGSCFSLQVYAESQDEVVFYVSPAGNDNNNGTTESTAFKTIAKASRMVAENVPATIYLAKNATFTMPYNADTIAVASNKDITFIGDNSVIQGDTKPQKEGGNGGVFMHVYPNAGVKLQGISFRYGCRRDWHFGGAIIFEGERLEIDKCSFIGNEGNSGGGAIGSTGKDIIITNSIFDGNYLVSGYGSGGTIQHSGPPDGDPGSLIVRNCAFLNGDCGPDVMGTVLGFNYKENPAIYPDAYTNLSYIEVANSLFKDNGKGASWNYVRLADISLENSLDVEVNIINNTFYNDRAISFELLLAPFRMINNIFYNDPDRLPVAGLANNYILVTSTPSFNREEIEGYNNVFVGNLGWDGWNGNEDLVDDPCFTSNKELYGNQIYTSKNDLSLLGLATAVSNDKEVVYLPILNASSILIDKGKASYTVDGRELIPAKDINGKGVVNTKDVGSFEYGDETGIIGTNAASGNLFSLYRLNDGFVVKNETGDAFQLTVRTIDGRTVYSTNVSGEAVIDKAIVDRAHQVLIITGSNSKTTVTKKAIMF
jgi:hypothetical protein